MTKTRVLLMAEDITLAQVVRLAALGRTLDPTRFEVHFACARFDPLVFEGAPFVRHPIHTVDARWAFRRLERGQRLYPKRVLAGYVEEELALFARVKPDVVVGDLRFSLSVSAPFARIPYAALINAYWSRAMVRSAFPLPEHPIVRLLGERIARESFPRALPYVFAHFAAPVNALRRKYGLSPLGDLIDLLMFGDLTLFPDVPALTPLARQEDTQVFLGPVPWAPTVARPDWWDAFPAGTSAYLTLGSSGRIDRLPIALRGLARLGLPVMVATANRADPASLNVGSGVHAATYLPGDEAARRATFVVCNGGSTTAYQALSEGRPVLGIASNLDQYLAMTAIQDAGAGILLRSDALTEAGVAEAARQLIEQPRYAEAARRMQSALRAYDSGARFAEALARVC